MLRSRKKLLPLFFDPTSPVRLSHFPPGFLSRPVFARKPTARRSAFLDLQNPHGKIRRSYVGAGRLDYPLLDQYFFQMGGSTTNWFRFFGDISILDNIYTGKNLNTCSFDKDQRVMELFRNPRSWICWVGDVLLLLSIEHANPRDWSKPINLGTFLYKFNKTPLWKEKPHPKSKRRSSSGSMDFFGVLIAVKKFRGGKTWR